MARRTLFSDDFNRADVPGGLGGSWDLYPALDHPSLVSQHATTSGANETWCASTHPTSLPNDQWSQALVFSMDASLGAVGLLLRWAAPNDASGYLVIASTYTNNTRIFRIDAGTFSGALATVAGVWANGDTVRFEAVGSVLSVYVNASGTPQLTHDTSGDGTIYTGGRAGLIVFSDTGHDAILDDFASGDFVSGRTAAPLLLLGVG